MSKGAIIIRSRRLRYNYPDSICVVDLKSSDTVRAIRIVSGRGPLGIDGLLGSLPIPPMH